MSTIAIHQADCFEISAKMPEGATRVVDEGGPKFKEDAPNTNLMAPARSGLMSFGAFGHGRLKGVITMATLASNLSRQGYGPVQDATGLTRKYGVDLTWTPDKAFEPGAGDAPASAAAIAAPKT